MTLCYRTLFVLAVAVRETLTAHAARPGHATLRLSLRSLDGLAACGRGTPQVSALHRLLAAAGILPTGGPPAAVRS